MLKDNFVLGRKILGVLDLLIRFGVKVFIG